MPGSRRASIVLPVPGAPLGGDRRHLPADVREVRRRGQRWCGAGRMARHGWPGLAFEHVHHVAQRVHGRDLEVFDEGGFGGGLAGDQQTFEPGGAGAFGHRECAVTGPQRAGERKLAEHRTTLQRRQRHLAAGREHAAGDGQVEPGAALAQVRRSEVGDDARERELEA